MPIFMTMSKTDFYVNGLKPMFDRLFAFILLILLLPLFIVLAGILWMHFRGSPFFIQKRPGKGGSTFNLLKFKTMKVEGDRVSITSLGKVFRASSLDELPQLINVWKGEMSFVGPRPLLLEYMPYYNHEEMRRHEVLPGITGWAQVNGRNKIDWGKRMSLDVYYVDNISFWLDLKISFMTLGALLKRDPASDQKIIKFNEYASKR